MSEGEKRASPLDARRLLMRATANLEILSTALEAARSSVAETLTLTTSNPVEDLSIAVCALREIVNNKACDALSREVAHDALARIGVKELELPLREGETG
jgi:hypothetical protein